MGKTVERPHPLTGVAKSWIALSAIVLVAGREIFDGNLEELRDLGPFVLVMLGVAAAVIVLTLVWGIVQWRTTTFVADDDEFRIERNFLSHTSSRISYGKIQSVDVQRSLVARLLGLSSVSIDVGGSGGQKLEFLGRERADALRDHLLARMRNLAHVPDPAQTPTPPSGDAAGQTQQAPSTPGAPAPLETVLKVPASTLILGLFVSSVLPWLVGALAFFLFGIITARGFIVAFGGAFLAVGGFVWSQVTSNWDFTLNRVPDGLHIRRGLFTKASRSLKADRIQAVSIHQDYLQRLTGLYRMRVTVLGFGIGDDEGGTSDIVLPYGTWDDVTRVLAAFWPGISLDRILRYPQPDRARWLTPLGFKHHKWGYDDQTLVAHHGWLDHTISLVPHRRMQSLDITQGPLQRRLGLATVNVHTTDGPVNLSIYHLDVHDARLLYEEQVERGRIARETPGEPGYLTALPAPDASQRRPDWPDGDPVACAGVPPQQPMPWSAPVDEYGPEGQSAWPPPAPQEWNPPHPDDVSPWQRPDPGPDSTPHNQ